MKNFTEFGTISEKVLIYGARSIALGTCLAMRKLFPEKELLGFLVSCQKGNPETLGGLPVMELADYVQKTENKNDITVLIGTPETEHDKICVLLKQNGFSKCIGINWKMEEILMERYFASMHKFFSLHDLNAIDITLAKRDLKKDFCVFIVKNHNDQEVRNHYDKKTWMYTLQAGASQTSLTIADYSDQIGDNISEKNGNYCELTALYWIWKHMLSKSEDDFRYYGMFQYRRLLDVNEQDMIKMDRYQIEVILPFPTVHEPDICEHHSRYVREEDWRIMLQAVTELQPDYAVAFEKILRQPYLYNYNILMARKEVLRDYCAWLFPILKRTEENSGPKRGKRNDRYIGYLGESLLTLYFLYNANKYRIVHTGRVMVT